MRSDIDNVIKKWQEKLADAAAQGDHTVYLDTVMAVAREFKSSYRLSTFSDTDTFAYIVHSHIKEGRTAYGTAYEIASENGKTQFCDQLSKYANTFTYQRRDLLINAYGNIFEARINKLITEYKTQLVSAATQCDWGAYSGILNDFILSDMVLVNDFSAHDRVRAHIINAVINDNNQTAYQIAAAQKNQNGFRNNLKDQPYFNYSQIQLIKKSESSLKEIREERNTMRPYNEFSVYEANGLRAAIHQFTDSLKQAAKDGDYRTYWNGVTQTVLSYYKCTASYSSSRSDNDIIAYIINYPITYDISYDGNHTAYDLADQNGKQSFCDSLKQSNLFDYSKTSTSVKEKASQLSSKSTSSSSSQSISSYPSVVQIYINELGTRGLSINARSELYTYMLVGHKTLMNYAELGYWESYRKFFQGFHSKVSGSHEGFSCDEVPSLVFNAPLDEFGNTAYDLASTAHQQSFCTNLKNQPYFINTPKKPQIIIEKKEPSLTLKQIIDNSLSDFGTSTTNLTVYIKNHPKWYQETFSDGYSCLIYAASIKGMTVPFFHQLATAYSEHEAAYVKTTLVDALKSESGSRMIYRQQPIHQAAFQGNKDLVAYLLREGVDINARNGEQQTPLHRAAHQNNSDVCQFLIEKGARLDHKDINQYLPSCRYIDNQFEKFTTAIKNGNEATIKNFLAENPSWPLLLVKESNGSQYSVLEYVVKKQQTFDVDQRVQSVRPNAEK